MPQPTTGNSWEVLSVGMRKRDRLRFLAMAAARDKNVSELARAILISAVDRYEQDE